MSQEAQEPQWFVAADGTVIQSWPPGPDNDRLKYVRFATSRRLELSDLYALDERFEVFKASMNRSSKALVALFVLAVTGILFVWLVLPRFGVGYGVALLLTAVLVLTLVLGTPIVRTITRGSRTNFDQIYLDAGFESSVPKVLKDSEARALLDAPGTVAGRRRGGAEY